MVASILDYLEWSAEQYPDGEAYEDGNETATFSEMRERAKGIGTAFLRKGISHGPVLVYMKKSVAMVSAFFGITACGCSYCPVDTQMPEERLRMGLDILKPCAIVTTEAFREKTEGFKAAIPVFFYEDLVSEDQDLELLKRGERRIDTDPLYILFTSGSTGIPKGVAIPHKAAMDYVEWFTGKFELKQGDALGNQAELYFDLSVQDVYAPIICGCKTVFLSPSLFSTPDRLMSDLMEKKITAVSWVPSALCLVANLDGMASHVPECLRLVTFCGEVMPCKQLNYWRSRLPHTYFVNLYGPTEATVACTYYPILREFSDEEVLPIGIPCENTKILVLNERDEPVEGDQIGELCVIGSSLALGYYGSPEKTKEVFVQNPCNPDFPERIYRTGDLAYYGADGNLMYVSRKDFQIKHLGYRIELGEIETAAGLQEGMKECACIYDEQKKRILLYYTGKKWDSRELKIVLSKRLPQYMIPNRVCYLEEMPHNRNGKVDRKQLKDQLKEKSVRN